MPKGTPKNTKAKATKEPPAQAAPAGQQGAGVVTKEAEKVGVPIARAKPPGVMSDEWVEPYLSALAESGQVVKSAQEAGVSTHAIIRRRLRDEVFKRREIAAQEEASTLFESEAIRRAVDGVVTSLTTRADGSTLQKIEYSDAILLRLLEKRETGSWRQKQQIEHSAPGMFATRAERKAALEKMRAEMAEQKAIDHDRPLPPHVEKTIGGRVVTEGK